MEQVRSCIAVVRRPFIGFKSVQVSPYARGPQIRNESVLAIAHRAIAHGIDTYPCIGFYKSKLEIPREEYVLGSPQTKILEELLQGCNLRWINEDRGFLESIYSKVNNDLYSQAYSADISNLTSRTIVLLCDIAFNRCYEFEGTNKDPLSLLNALYNFIVNEEDGKKTNVFCDMLLQTSEGKLPPYFRKGHERRFAFYI